MLISSAFKVTFYHMEDNGRYMYASHSFFSERISFLVVSFMQLSFHILYLIAFILVDFLFQIQVRWIKVSIFKNSHAVRGHLF